MTKTIATISVAREISVLQIKRCAGALELIANAVDELTDMGTDDLDGRAALGFANVIHSCAQDLAKLVPQSGALKGEGQ